jgi:hypothetical protein
MDMNIKERLFRGETSRRWEGKREGERENVIIAHHMHV